MKLPYEKPVIKKLHTGLMNKFGRSPSYTRKVRTEIDGVAIADLVARFGSPLFVYSERTIRQKYRELRTAFSTRYPNVVFGWSYKTNYLNAICRVFHQEGSFAEVVSGFEYEKARHNGMPGHQIIFNGPWKDLDSLRRAVAEGALIQVDNRDEILTLERLAEELDASIEVGIRVHVDTGTHAVWSKFGFNAEDGEALRMIGWIRITHACESGGFIVTSAPSCWIPALMRLRPRRWWNWPSLRKRQVPGRWNTSILVVALPHMPVCTDNICHRNRQPQVSGIMPTRSAEPSSNIGPPGGSCRICIWKPGGPWWMRRAICCRVWLR